MLKIGDSVQKKSLRPFKNGEKIQTIISFKINEADPKKRECAVFNDDSVCNTSILVLAGSPSECKCEKCKCEKQ